MANDDVFLTNGRTNQNLWWSITSLHDSTSAVHVRTKRTEKSAKRKPISNNIRGTTLIIQRMKQLLAGPRTLVLFGLSLHEPLKRYPLSPSISLASVTRISNREQSWRQVTRFTFLPQSKTRCDTPTVRPFVRSRSQRRITLCYERFTREGTRDFHSKAFVSRWATPAAVLNECLNARSSNRGSFSALVIFSREVIPMMLVRGWNLRRAIIFCKNPICYPTNESNGWMQWIFDFFSVASSFLLILLSIVRRFILCILSWNNFLWKYLSIVFFF